MPNDLPPKRPFKNSGPKRPFSSKPRFNTDKKPRFKAEDSGEGQKQGPSKFNSDRRPNFKSGERPDFKSDRRSNFKPREKTEYKSDGKPGFKSGEKPEFKSGARSNFKPRERDDFKSDRKFKPRGDFNKRPRRPSFHKDPSQERPQTAPTEGNIQKDADGDQNLSPFIKRYSKLKTEKFRLQESKFLIEGPKLIADIIALSPSIFADVLISEEFTDKEFLQLIKRQRVLHRIVPQKDLGYLSDVQTPQGVIGVAHFSNLRPNWSLAHYVTLLDGVQDPGNIGAIFRTSLSLGMDSVILGKGCCEPHNPKVVRASASAFLRLPFEAGVDLSSKIKFLRQQGFTIVGTSPHSRLTLDGIKLRKKVALVFGNEGTGIDDKISSKCDELVKIPQVKDMESLNVAVAHGILTHSLVSLKK